MAVWAANHLCTSGERLQGWKQKLVSGKISCIHDPLARPGGGKKGGCSAHFFKKGLPGLAEAESSMGFLSGESLRSWVNWERTLDELGRLWMNWGGLWMNWGGLAASGVWLLCH